MLHLQSQLETLKTVPWSFFKQVDGVISNELKDFDIRSSSKDDFKHNVYNKYLQTCGEQIPRCWSLEAFSVFDSTNWPSEYLPGEGEEHIEELTKHYHPIVEHQAKADLKRQPTVVDCSGSAAILAAHIS